MDVLLVSGLGPSLKNSDYLDGTMLDRRDGRANTDRYLAGTALDGFHLGMLGFRHQGHEYPLLRPRYDNVPHLTTFAVQEIIERAGHVVEVYDTTHLWSDEGAADPPDGDFRAVLLSTSFIWTERDLRRAVDWVGDHFPGVPLVLGGQFSNLKFSHLMRQLPSVDFIVRGDGEEAIPALLRTIETGADPAGVPNLVYRHPRELLGYRLGPFSYLDLDAYPSPAPRGTWSVVPYESMRGCPFDCKFCSFPAASPKWRYKSARKIADDWTRYAEVNGASYISAMDSTFTVPPTRLRELTSLLPAVGIGWEGYSRANVLKSAELVDAIAATHCQFLSIGFESMSDNTLKHMSKRVTRKDTHLLTSAGPGEDGDPVLNALRDEIAKLAPRLEWAGYLSTTGVYGDHGGGWVDESTPPQPTSRRGRWRVEAESAWTAIPGLPLHIFRLAGIYGPGRGPFETVRSGKARRIVTELFTLLHEEPELLPPEWQVGCDGVKGVKTARRVCDFIAGMTDKFAIEEHKRLFDLSDPRA